VNGKKRKKQKLKFGKFWEILGNFEEKMLSRWGCSPLLFGTQGDIFVF